MWIWCRPGPRGSPRRSFRCRTRYIQNARCQLDVHHVSASLVTVGDEDTVGVLVHDVDLDVEVPECDELLGPVALE